MAVTHCVKVSVTNTLEMNPRGQLYCCSKVYF